MVKRYSRIDLTYGPPLRTFATTREQRQPAVHFHFMHDGSCVVLLCDCYGTNYVEHRLDGTLHSLLNSSHSLYTTHASRRRVLQNYTIANSVLQSRSAHG